MRFDKEMQIFTASTFANFSCQKKDGEKKFMQIIKQFDF